MADQISTTTSRTSQKRQKDSSHGAVDNEAKRQKRSHDAGRSTSVQIERLGEDIPTSPKKYNEIVPLLRVSKGDDKEASAAVFALCRVFSVLIVDGRFKKLASRDERKIKITKWLRARRDEYDLVLLRRLSSQNPANAQQALHLIMQLVKAQLTSANQQWTEYWTGKHYFRNLLKSLVDGSVNREAVKTLTKEYINKFDEVRYYTFVLLSQSLEIDRKDSDVEQDLSGLVDLVGVLDPPSSDIELGSYFHDYSKEQIISKKPPRGLAESQRQAQRAFSKLFACDLNPKQRNALLKMITPVIVPWLQTPTHVLDILADSFEAGGSTSLLALSGVYEMMTKYNMDYPSFYQKLYSLLDDNILHLTHRARVFRLLDQFLGSSHLPAAMVASFIKRLSRLALQGPPGAIVAIVPWVYNMLQMHPSCTFMVHREPRTEEDRQKIGEEGADDPFDMLASGPMNTRAIDSCLWELDTLQSHFHPNVASLVRVISQEFRKQSYSLEDFLDHSYGSLVAGDLGKEMKKPPVVEYEIPKHIFTDAHGDATLLHTMMDIVA